ncbi:MAG: 16S rRNA (guanine(966)-N(2))-methyltransferase RsmD [Eubacteriales bacterium]|nr:16S rRNA (guanine(966)-N(2))-methyltransferase RsmD [Eubacteriales bacterium]MDD3199885.1 16S rRNA (guanine(966)-N(2))-methyltransferase RsmD [Eubacteriales bacterium]MDD4630277.1 16S rRNA (guanine(966)-N(2))-methyltransferase RsmD [Eubacteriales bacterium]
MRIIAGEFKGRRLNAPKDDNIRPTSDKVKEAIFSIIAANIADAVVIDLFSGTGNLGLEALSRGSSRCYFGDRSKDSIKITLQNIKYCKQEDKSITILGDFEKVLRKIPEKANIIFLDPPYKAGLLVGCFDLISELSLLSEEGVIVAEHAAEEPLPDVMAGFTRIKEKKYGSISTSIYSSADDLEEGNK